MKSVYLVPANINLNEVVITAQYEPTTIDKSVQRIKIIDSEKISQMGAVSLRDVLTNQLNVRLEQDNILGSGMSLQGIRGENVKILVDGVPVIGRLDGNIDLSQINLNNVERIELVEGPLSVQYGTNALAGTINIITKKTQSQRLSAGVTTYYESIGTYNLNATLGLAKLKHNLQLSGGRNYFDGWNDEAPFHVETVRVADSLRAKQWKPKEQYFASASYQYSFRNLDLGVKSAYFDEVIINRGSPIRPLSENTFDDHYYTTRIDNSLSLKGKLAPRWSINALAAYNYFLRKKKTVYKDLTTLEETVSAASDQDTTGSNALMSRASFIYSNPFSKLNYEFGYDVNYESSLGKRVEGNVQYMGDFALFATSEYKPVKALVLKPGLRYAYNTVYTTPLVPSIHLKWDVSDNHVLRASYARGFRAPSIKELYFSFYDTNHNIGGNKDLIAEKSDNYLLSYNYNRDLKKCRLLFDLGFFYNDIFNLITLAQINSVDYTYINVGRYQTMGAQVTTSLNFKNLFLQPGFNYTGRYVRLSETLDLPSFVYSPELLCNASYRIKKTKTNIALFYKYTGRLPNYLLVGETVTATFISDFQIMDLTVSQSVLKDRINLVMGCKNIFDVTNINSTSSTGGAHSTNASRVAMSTGRNYFIKLIYNFTKI